MRNEVSDSRNRLKALNNKETLNHISPYQITLNISLHVWKVVLIHLYLVPPDLNFNLEFKYEFKCSQKGTYFLPFWDPLLFLWKTGRRGKNRIPFSHRPSRKGVWFKMEPCYFEGWAQQTVIFRKKDGKNIFEWDLGLSLTYIHTIFSWQNYTSLSLLFSNNLSDAFKNLIKIKLYGTNTGKIKAPSTDLANLAVK